MNSIVPVLFALSLILSGCTDLKDSPPPKEKWQEIAGRYNREMNLYRAKTPSSWIRRDPRPEEPLEDTKKALCEFFITQEESTIRIAVHNFPAATLDERIPPVAQTTRWKQQFTSLDPIQQETRPQSFSGYAGYLYEGKGLLDEEEAIMMAWALQLDPAHFRALSRTSYPVEMRADVTIKATGPAPFMARHRKEIMRFARSFELIKEIPAE